MAMKTGDGLISGAVNYAGKYVLAAERYEYKKKRSLGSG
jgi:hypothetical protein